jgi:hypothetical protein
MDNYLIKALFLIFVFILLFFFIRYVEKKSLYFPLRTIEATPEDIGLDYEDVSLITKDGLRISAWYIPSESQRAVILFSHGNGGNISHRLDKIKMLHEINVDILIFDYRGYGTSQGSPSEEGLYLDVEAAYNYLIKQKNIPAQKIVGYGESLGGAVIIDLASKYEMGGIIVEGTFTSIRDMAKRYFPFIPAFVYKTTFNSFEKIRGINFPKLHLHSMSDEVVPFELGKKLFDNAPEPKEFVKLQGGHNDSFIISRERYISSIDSFIEMKLLKYPF